MPATSKPEEHSTATLGEPEVYGLTSFWDYAKAEAQSNVVLPVDQHTYMDVRTVGVSAERPLMVSCAGIPMRTSFTDIGNVLSRRPIHSTQDGGLVIDPSAMAVNQPYTVDLPGVTVWAVKDDTGDVVFYSPEE